MGEYKQGDFGYFEFVIKTKVKGQVMENLIKGHYEIVEEERGYILLREEEVEIPVAKRNIVKFERKNR